MFGLFNKFPDEIAKKISIIAAFYKQDERYPSSRYMPGRYEIIEDEARYV